MHLRSSSRCCRRLMEPICRISRSISFGSGSATSGIVILRDRVLHSFCQAIESALNGKVFVARDFGDLRLEMLGRIGLLQLQLADLIMDLALELIAGLFELSHEFAPGTGKLRYLLGPK